MSDDLISRQAAIDAVHEDLDGCRNWNASGTETANEVEMVLDCLPSAQTWIPVTERLPEAEDMYQPPEQRYLCQLEAYGERKFCVLSRLKGAVSPFWDWYGVAVRDHEVTAWMPLPEPYKEATNE